MNIFLGRILQPRKVDKMHWSRLQYAESSIEKKTCISSFPISSSVKRRAPIQSLIFCWYRICCFSDSLIVSWFSNKLVENSFNCPWHFRSTCMNYFSLHSSSCLWFPISNPDSIILKINVSKISISSNQINFFRIFTQTPLNLLLLYY